MIDITGTDPLSLEELGGVNSEKLEKWGIFNLQRNDWILMKFYFWKDIMSQSSYFKSWPDPVKSKSGGGEPKILENA